MGTLLFLLIKMLKVFETPYDYAIFCLLLSLDAQTLLRFWLWRRTL